MEKMKINLYKMHNNIFSNFKIYFVKIIME